MSEFRWTTPSCPPLIALPTTAATGSSRWVSARISMGRLAPDRPSTLPGLSRRVAMFEGVAPRMSVSTSTPSPLSNWRASSCAWGRIASGSSWTVTPSCCTCSGRLPSTWLAPWMSASPKAPCATMRTPTMTGIRAIKTLFCSARRISVRGALPRRASCSAGGFDGVEKHPGDVEAGLLGDFLKTGGAGDVDFGEPVADHVQAHQKQSVARKLRPERVRDLQVATGQRPGDPGTPGGEVAARLPRLGDARKAMGHRFTRDQQDALVAVPDLRDVALCHDRLPAVAQERLDDDVAVGIGRRDTEHRLSAHAVEGLQHHVAVGVDECLELSGKTGDQGRRGELRVFRDGELLAVVADRTGVVEYFCALLLRKLQEPGAGDVLRVERRVLAHEHRPEFCKRRFPGGICAIPRVLLAGERQAAALAEDAPAFPHQAFLQHEKQFVTALRGLDHHRVGRILVNLERGQRIGDEGDSHLTKLNGSRAARQRRISPRPCISNWAAR